MKRPHKEEALSPSGLPGGVPSRFFDDPKESELAMNLSKKVVELVERKLKES